MYVIRASVVPQGAATTNRTVFVSRNNRIYIWLNLKDGEKWKY